MGGLFSALFGPVFGAIAASAVSVGFLSLIFMRFWGKERAKRRDAEKKVDQAKEVKEIGQNVRAETDDDLARRLSRKP